MIGQRSRRGVPRSGGGVQRSGRVAPRSGGGVSRDRESASSGQCALFRDWDVLFRV